MKIQTVKPFAPLKLHIIAEDGRQHLWLQDLHATFRSTFNN